MLLALLFIVLLGAEEIYDVRKVRWGMTREQVRNSETWTKLSEQNKISIYGGTLFGEFCKLVYYFENEKLVSLHYEFHNDAVLKAARPIAEVLREKYGEPVSVPSKRRDTTMFRWNSERTTILFTHFRGKRLTALTVMYQDLAAFRKDLNKEHIKNKKEASTAF